MRDVNMTGASEIYGKLQEGLHITGYSFERACGNLEWLLEEDRWKLAGPGFDDINKFLETIRLDKFRQVAENRKRIAVRIKELTAASNVQIAKVLGVDEGTVRNDLRSENSEDGAKKHNKNNGSTNLDSENSEPSELSGEEAAKLAQRRAERKDRDIEAEQRRFAEAREKIALAPKTLKFDMRHGDFRTVLLDVKGIDAIITDPPYGKEFLHLLRDLAAFADRALKPDGILAVLFGQTYLPDAYHLLSGFRPYRWTACYCTQGPAYVSHDRAVHSNWKPVLIYGGRTIRFADLIQSSGDVAAKERHEWGQDYGAFETLVERLTVTGDTVVDPFAGSGTTLLAANALGRHAIGCDIKIEHVNKARELIDDDAAA